MKLTNQTRNIILADKLDVADNFLSRATGLLNRKELKAGEGLLIRPCNSVHSLFMRFAIDVLFVDKQNKIVKIIPFFKPFRLSGLYSTAFFVIELPAGTAQSSNTQPGDSLALEP